MNYYDTIEKIVDCNQREFKSNFWVDRTTLLMIIDKFKLYNLEVKLKDLLLFLHFLRCYQTLDQMKIFHNRSQKTILKYISKVRDLFLELIEHEKSFQPHYRFKQLPLLINENKIYSVIDTSFFPICKPSENEGSNLYYSAKHKMHGIKYEVVCGIADGHINWVSEIFYPGSTRDITIARDGLIENYKLKKKEKILGDKSYYGEDIFMTPSKCDPNLLSEYEKTLEKIIFPYHQIIENIFSRIKACNILKHPFRGDIDDYGDYIKIIFYIHNLMIINHPMRDESK